MSVTVRYRVPFETRVPAKPKAKPPTRVARMLALAYHVEDLVDRGVLASYAEAAARLGVSRARLAQVVRLLDLSPRVQEAILLGETEISERRLRGVARCAGSDEQARLLSMDTHDS